MTKLSPIVNENTNIAIGMVMTLLCVSAGAVWTVATIKQVVIGLRDSMNGLTQSVDRLSSRISELEDEHAATRERIATLEGKL